MEDQICPQDSELYLENTISKAIAANDLLIRRKCGKSAMCPICEVSTETVEHLFFQCHWARCVWFGSGLALKTDVSVIQNFEIWWGRVISSQSPLTNIDITFISWILCYIWKGRDAKVFNGLDPNPHQVIEQAWKLSLEFHAACGLTKTSGDSAKVSKSSLSWEPSPINALKINVDSAYNANTNKAAIGIICRDYQGSFRWAFVDKVKSISAFMTEALAMKRALMIAHDLGNVSVIFESDCQTLVKCMQKGQTNLGEWTCRTVLEDILNLLSSYAGFSVSFVPRKGNCAADSLAADVGWVETPLAPLSLILAADVRSSSMSYNQDYAGDSVREAA